MDMNEINAFFRVNFNEYEIEYLFDAYRLPLEEMKKQIYMYDRLKPKMDEIKFIINIKVLYNVDPNLVINRIRWIRKIQKYLMNNQDKIIIPKTQSYYKLVRDNIPQIIKENGDIPIFRELNNEEYWEYLLEKSKEELLEVKKAKSIIEIKKELADTLEVLRAMAEFNGLTLEDIIEEADRKKITNGAFKRKLLLERVIEKNN